jgi:hypothetical protein
MSDVIQWQYREGTEVMAPIWWWGDYVISCRPNRYILSYRPTGQHKHIGIYDTLETAKSVAKYQYLLGLNQQS